MYFYGVTYFIYKIYNLTIAAISNNNNKGGNK